MKQEYLLLRVGLVGIGLDTYWNQFAGLQGRLEEYTAAVAYHLQGPEITIINLGLLDNIDRSLEISHTCRKEDIDVLVVHIATYALSSIVLPVVQRAGVPVLLLNLQPSASINYARLNHMRDREAMTAEWLAYCSSCAVPEFSNVLRRLGIPVQIVTGSLEGDPGCWMEMAAWLKATAVKKMLAHSRLGVIGHYYGGMLDITTDLALISGRFGLYIEQLEADEITENRRYLSETAVKDKMLEFQKYFLIEPDCQVMELDRAARTAVAIDVLVHEHDLDLLAYYYKGSGIPEQADVMSSMILGASVLTGRGIPVAGEYEVKNVIAMKILDRFEAGGSFSEFYALDLEHDNVLMGHDGPGHVGIAEGKSRVKPLRSYHGKVGSGLSVEMSVRHGPVTLLSIAEDASHGYKLVVAQGESVPGPILEIGNTNSRYKFSLGARRFVTEWSAAGPAHHCAIGAGHIVPLIEKLATLLHIPVQQIC